MARGKIDIDIHMCKGCELCYSACRFNVLQLSPPDEVNEYGYRYMKAVNPDNCTGCSMCGLMCPDSAITVWRFIKEN
jgi:2-oxoglutarate ferredoxin oxidoreductase subunit delta